MRGASRTVFTPRRRSGSTGWASSSVLTGLVRIENQSSCEFISFISGVRSIRLTPCVFSFDRCEPYRLNFTALPYANPGDRWLIACVVPPASVSGTNTSGSFSPIGGSNARMKDNPAIVADLVEVSLSFYFRIGNSTDVVFFLFTGHRLFKEDGREAGDCRVGVGRYARPKGAGDARVRFRVRPKHASRHQSQPRVDPSGRPLEVATAGPGGGGGARGSGSRKGEWCRTVSLPYSNTQLPPNYHPMTDTNHHTGSRGVSSRIHPKGLARRLDAPRFAFRRGERAGG